MSIAFRATVPIITGSCFIKCACYVGVIWVAGIAVGCIFARFTTIRTRRAILLERIIEKTVWAYFGRSVEASLVGGV